MRNSVRRHNSEDFNVWPSFTDVITGIFLFLLFVFIILIIQQNLYSMRLSELEQFLGTLSEEMDALGREFGEKSEESGISVNVEEGRIVLQERVLFDFGKSYIKPNSKERLRRLGVGLRNILDRHPDLLAISIDGHADNVGTYRFNLELGSERAISVLDFLQHSAGIDPMNYDISANTYGEYRPVISYRYERAEPKNRRIEIRIIPKFDRLLKKLKEK